MDNRDESTNNVFSAKESDDLSRTSPTQQKGSIFKKALFFLLIILLLGTTAFISYSTGKKSSQSKANRLNQLSNPNSPMFANLTGSIVGKVTKVEGNNIYIDSTQGGKGIFNIPESISVTEISQGKLTEIGSTKDSIRLNENAQMRIVVLGFNDGYAINSITYLKDSPLELQAPSNPLETPKPATPAAKIKK